MKNANNNWVKHNLGVFPCIFSLELTVKVLISCHVNSEWPIVVIASKRQ